MPQKKSEFLKRFAELCRAGENTCQAYILRRWAELLEGKSSPAPGGVPLGPACLVCQKPAVGGDGVFAYCALHLDEKIRL